MIPLDFRSNFKKQNTSVCVIRKFRQIKITRFKTWHFPCDFGKKPLVKRVIYKHTSNPCMKKYSAHQGHMCNVNFVEKLLVQNLFLNKAYFKCSCHFKTKRFQTTVLKARNGLNKTFPNNSVKRQELVPTSDPCIRNIHSTMEVCTM